MRVRSFLILPVQNRHSAPPNRIPRSSFLGRVWTSCGFSLGFLTAASGANLFVQFLGRPRFEHSPVWFEVYPSATRAAKISEQHSQTSRMGNDLALQERNVQSHQPGTFSFRCHELYASDPVEINQHNFGFFSRYPVDIGSAKKCFYYGTKAEFLDLKLKVKMSS